MTLQADPKMIVKDIGKVSFFENVETIEYDLDLQPFFSNAQSIFNATEELVAICKNSTENNNCNHYINNIKHNLEEVRMNVNLIKSEERRKKRNFWASAARQFFHVAKHVIPSTFFAAGAAAIVSDTITDQKLLQAAKTRHNEIKKDLNNTLLLINVTAGALNETKKSLRSLKKEFKKSKSFEEIMDTIQLGLTQHYKNAEIFTGILDGQIREQVFKFYNIENFTQQIQEINKRVFPDFALPSLNVFDLLKISSTYYTRNSTHIKVIVEIPILNRELSALKAYIPVPFLENNITKIFNTNAKFVFVQNETLKMISREDLKLCLNINELTICNSLMTEIMDSVDPCIHSFFLGNHDECHDKAIEPHNYIIDTSGNSVYCFILKPFALKISCYDGDQILNLTESREIHFEDHCEIYKISRNIAYNASTYTAINITHNYIPPNLSVFSTNGENITDELFIVDRFEIELLQIYDRTKRMQEDSSSGEEIETEINFSKFFGKIKDFSEAVFYTIAYLFSYSSSFYWLVIPFLIIVVITIWCRSQ